MSELLNRLIAEVLGYDVSEDERGFWHLYSPLGAHVHGMCNTATAAWTGVPDFEHDLNAVIEALASCDVVVTIQPDLVLMFTIHDTSISDVIGAIRSKFVASAYDDEYRDGDTWLHPTIQHLAASALLEYLLVQQRQL